MYPYRCGLFLFLIAFWTKRIHIKRPPAIYGLYRQFITVSERVDDMCSVRLKDESDDFFTPWKLVSITFIWSDIESSNLDITYSFKAFNISS